MLVLVAAARVHFLVREPHPLSISCHTVVTACCCDAESSATGISNTSRVPHGVSRASRLRQTRKKDLATHFQKTGHEYPMNSSGALSDTEPEGERMVQKDWTGFCCKVHKVARSWNQFDSINNNNNKLGQVESE